MGKTLLCICLLLLFSPSIASAHPVSFRNSVGIMGQHSPSLTHNQINYSVRHWYAIGVHHFNRNQESQPAHATLISNNFLLKRWNSDRFQANIYSLLGFGQSELNFEPEIVGMAGLQFDIEDRRYYFLTKYMELSNGADPELREFKVRSGIAPYIGNYSDMHTWLILEFKHKEFRHRLFEDELTPFLRVFYKNILFEIGQSFKGQTMFNYIAHF